MAFIPAATFGLIIFPVFLTTTMTTMDRMINQKVKDQLQPKEVLSMLLLFWSALSPHGFLLAASIFLVYPAYWRIDHGEKFAGFFSNELSPLWAMCLLSVGKTVTFAAVTFYLDIKNLLPLAPPIPFRTPQAELDAMDDDVRGEYMLVNGMENAVIAAAVATSANSSSAEEGEAMGGSAAAALPFAGADNTAVVLKHLRKVYPGGRRGGVAVAVVDSNLHVERGECFGLLGPNGAGKSTSVAMLTRHTAPTRGDAEVMGHSIRTAFPTAARSMGVVTQDNSLYGELTAAEHLWLFSRVRGVPEARIPSLVHDSLMVMELGPHAYKPSKRLSGGMKRKLCTALSLIGNPPVVLMDEPSSGLDPASRRNLWKVINETMKTRAVVLTTHLLDEAEALCSRLAIMTKGTVRCVGSPQHLRSKHGTGYQVTLTTKEMVGTIARDEAFAEVHAFVIDLFGEANYDATGTLLLDGESGGGGGENGVPAGAYIKNRNSRMLTYVVPLHRMSVPKAFTAFEENIERLKLDNYVISQPTLEQVFLEFTAEKERQHGVATNEGERALAEAWDDTDVRLAELSKSRCCGCERKQHTRLAMVRACMTFFKIIFASARFFGS